MVQGFQYKNVQKVIKGDCWRMPKFNVAIFSINVLDLLVQQSTLYQAPGDALLVKKNPTWYERADQYQNGQKLNYENTFYNKNYIL